MNAATGVLVAATAAAAAAAAEAEAAAAAAQQSVPQLLARLAAVEAEMEASKAERLQLRAEATLLRLDPWAKLRALHAFQEAAARFYGYQPNGPPVRCLLSGAVHDEPT